MLRFVQRMPLRRLVHTSTTRPVSSAIRGRVGLAFGASAVLTTYVTWKTLSQPGIALDSVAESSKARQAEPAADPVTIQETPSPQSPEAMFVAPEEIEQKAEEAAESTEAAHAGGENDEHAGGAFNPVTGEINWDCPCLGGMAHGPCGPQFREAFSCFVFSEQEPKGIDCVEKFKAMQDCFREHPEIYADDIMDDDDDDEAAALGAPTASPDGQHAEPLPESAPLSTQAEHPPTEDTTHASS